MLPASVIDEMERIMRQRYLQKGRLEKKVIAVSWADCCLPKEEGGLGIKRIRDWSTAANLKHLWDVVTKKRQSRVRGL